MSMTEPPGAFPPLCLPCLAVPSLALPMVGSWQGWTCC